MCQLEAVLLGRDVLGGEVQSCLERPCVHVCRADLCVEGDEDVAVILHGSLELRVRRLDGAPDAPEQVDLPAHPVDQESNGSVSGELVPSSG
jgi:hypothetical protein